MEAGKRQAIIDKLSFIANNAAKLSTPRGIPKPNRMLGALDGSMYALYGDANEEYDQIIELFLRAPAWSLKFSRSYIDKRVHALLNLLVQDGNATKVAIYVDEFIAEAEAYSTSYMVYLPVEGIVMQLDRMSVGPITLVNMAGNEFADLVHRAERGAARRGKTPEEIAEHLDRWEESVFSALRNRTVVTFETIAEATRAQERAEDQWRKVIDMLRYYVFLAYQKQINIGIGLQGDVRYGVGQAIACTPYFESLHVMSTSKSPHGLVINADVVRNMESVGVFALAGMLEPQGKTAFSDTLLRGVHWIADALTQVEPANEFLSLVSCFETFLTREPGDATTISNAVASGVGWVLGKDRQHRAELRKHVKDLYNKRSTISHGGQHDQLAKNLPELRDLVSTFVLAMVNRRDEFSKSGKAGLLEWIDEGPVRG